MHVLLYRVRGARATHPPSDRHPSNRTSTRFALPLALIHAPMPCGSVVEPIVALITRSLAGCCALSRCWRYVCRPWETRRALLPCPCVANASLVGLGIWMHVCMHACMCERMRGDKTIDWLVVAQLADTKREIEERSGVTAQLRARLTRQLCGRLQPTKTANPTDAFGGCEEIGNFR
ncbi:hypothetical protein IWZ03DRAFT_247045 [Phyllosticta citriasiana]|uniref:Uncharacterized protein n=1 Tax=Phyllosticta citriasiana TaxID=595635 RepID=A0ABR1KG26_9PEZI